MKFKIETNWESTGPRTIGTSKAHAAEVEVIRSECGINYVKSIWNRHLELQGAKQQSLGVYSLHREPGVVEQRLPAVRRFNLEECRRLSNEAQTDFRLR